MINDNWLFGKNLKELEVIVESYGEPKFRAKQLAQWLYSKAAKDISSMSSLSKEFRDTLANDYIVGRLDYSDKIVSKDGTIKYIFPTLKGGTIESVYIPDKDRATLCVSSQAGCKMNCDFCMTGKGGFHHQLITGEILNQINVVNQESPLTNIVYMGMGEPLDNCDNVMRSFEVITSPWGWAMSPMRVTLSTIGVLPKMKRFIEECNVHLAVSLHNPVAEQRAKIMPVQKSWDIKKVVELIKQYDFSHQRRVSFEYIMFDGFNDSDSHARSLIELLRGLRCRVNLIRFHKIPGCDLIGTSNNKMVHFRDTLTNAGIITTIRASRGEDIFAACGMLKGEKTSEKQV
ncbi:MAG: 23S rRNA (adenine(2503)-C(2))-methyltransferase RlmN [Rikenellaceae bacterium]